MYSIEAHGRTFGPYEATVHSNGVTKGDIRPILYDTAIVQLADNTRSFALGYRTSKSLFGKEISHADIVDMGSGDTFSLQVSNIFLIKAVAGDLKILAKTGEELKWYENFGRTEYQIEADGDKKEITPLGYFDMYVRFDEEYYYPIILNESVREQATVKRFFDYYGFKSYTDAAGIDHFLLLIEDETSSEAESVWYWTDNFRKSSDVLDFGDDSESVEDWSIDGNGRISMTLTSGAKWYVDPQGKLMQGTLPQEVLSFQYDRYFEDTDSSVIVGKNSSGLFLIDREQLILSKREQDMIVYFEDFIACSKNAETPLFLMKTKNGDVVIVDHEATEVLATDLDGTEHIVSFQQESDTVYAVQLKGEGTRVYATP